MECYHKNAHTIFRYRVSTFLSDPENGGGNTFLGNVGELVGFLRFSQQ
jgi:hypothetical protein